MGYVIFVCQFAGVCELEWPECGALERFAMIDSYMVSASIESD